MLQRVETAGISSVIPHLSGDPVIPDVMVAMLYVRGRNLSGRHGRGPKNGLQPPVHPAILRAVHVVRGLTCGGCRKPERMDEPEDPELFREIPAIRRAIVPEIPLYGTHGDQYGNDCDQFQDAPEQGELLCGIT